MDNHIVKVRQGGVVSLWSLPSICSFGLSHNPPQWRIVWQAERISAYSLTTRLVSCFNVWVPRLAHNGLPVDARSFEEFVFVFVFFVFLTAGLRCHLFSWLEPWCESQKTFIQSILYSCLLSRQKMMNPYCECFMQFIASWLPAPTRPVYCTFNKYYDCLKN